MKPIYIIILFGAISYTPAIAQGKADRVVSEVERNNTGLSALRQKAAAQKLGNKTGIYLDNPEIGFNYLWGSPTLIGTRIDLSVEQSFDFPTAYRYKKQIAGGRNEQVDLEYLQARFSLIQEVRRLCIDLTYRRFLQNELTRRLENAHNMVDSYQKKFDQGDTGIIDLNKARLNLLAIQKEVETNEIEQQALLANLASLNGGISVEWNATDYFTREIPADFDAWFQKAESENPVLSWLKKELEISGQQEKLQSALGLPGFSTGYLSEKVVGEHFQGITLGMSLPLWENKNAVKQAKAQSLAVQEMERDRRTLYYNHLKMIHNKAISLQKSVDDYRLVLQTLDNGTYLTKALEAGEIALIDYLLELSLFYDAQKKFLETERDLNLTIAELYQFLN